MTQDTLYSIGHSTHSAETLVSLLKKHGVGAVADVRSSPYSRMNPQFNKHTLADTLKKNSIAYVYLGRELGARSENPDCYQNGKVQYDLLAQTDLFQDGLRRVREGMTNYTVALLCAEKDPLTCHRAILVCRHLVSEGTQVRHILADGNTESHEQATERLLKETGFSESAPSLIGTREELLQEAYSIRGQKIAYSDTETAKRSPSSAPETARLLEAGEQ